MIPSSSGWFVHAKLPVSTPGWCSFDCQKWKPKQINTDKFQVVESGWCNSRVWQVYFCFWVTIWYHTLSPNEPPTRTLLQWFFNRDPYNRLWNNPHITGQFFIPNNSPKQPGGVVFFIAHLVSNPSPTSARSANSTAMGARVVFLEHLGHLDGRRSNSFRGQQLARGKHSWSQNKRFPILHYTILYYSVLY